MSFKHTNRKPEDMSHNLEIANIGEKLKYAELDSTVGIRMVSVIRGKDLGFYTTEIDERVQAHVHREGDEFYHVLRGEGLIYLGLTIFTNDNTPISVDWTSPVKVSVDDVFNIPAGYAHSLKNIGEQPLLINFICPPDHLDKDRYIVDNP